MELIDLKNSLEKAKFSLMKAIKEKSASPMDIMKNTKKIREQISFLEMKIKEKENLK